MTTISLALKAAAAKLKRLPIARPELDAEVLLAWVIKRPKEFLYAHGEQPLNSRQSKQFAALLKRRLKGEPAAYLTGVKEFYGWPVKVNKRVLIPRPETELLVESALDLITKCNHPLLIDVGTGSGAILLAVGKNVTSVKLIGTDASAAALAVARDNLRRFRLTKIKLRQGDLLTPVKKWVVRHRDEVIVVANLPYLTTKQWQEAAEIKHEPRQALDGGPDGLNLYRRLFIQLADIKKSVYLIIEFDPGQSLKLKRLIKKHWPAARPLIKKDLAGRDRCLVVRLDSDDY